MSNNSDTISQLSEALNSLIIAYEELQNENNGLKSEINNLKSEKDSLKHRLEEFENNTQQQNNNISSMLGKIESLLGNNKGKTNDLGFMATQKPFETRESTTISQPSKQEEPKETQDSGETKIDLNRMASLLNGLGK